jgi:hypothetical protein
MTTVINGSYPAVNSDSDATINGLTVGKGGGNQTNNTAVGANSTLVANTTGTHNTAIGSGALPANTTGGSNTSVGSRTLENNNANNNTAIGYQSMLSNTSGTNNAALGWVSLNANTTGSSNTGLGVQALASNTTASNNTAVGYQAGYSNTTANNSTAVGYRALYTSTTAANNTAVGLQSGLSVTTGYENVFIGANAGNTVSTGIRNTIVGNVAGSSLTTGSNNTFVGANGASGGCGEAVTTGSKNTILGGYTGNQGGLDIRTASNNIVISDGDGNPRMYVDSTGSIGFKAFSPVRNSGAGVYGMFIGTPADSVFEVASTGTVQVNNITASSGAVFQSRINGTTVGSISVSGSTTTYNTSSDYRLKENVQPMTGALAKLALVKPVTYTWKINGSQGQGFIAHELAEIFPDAVTGVKDALDENGNIDPQGVDYAKLVATLTAAIQELKAEFDAYKATHP